MALLWCLIKLKYISLKRTLNIMWRDCVQISDLADQPRCLTCFEKRASFYSESNPSTYQDLVFFALSASALVFSSYVGLQDWVAVENQPLFLDSHQRAQ
jgi:hypothetical protein